MKLYKITTTRSQLVSAITPQDAQAALVKLPDETITATVEVLASIDVAQFSDTAVVGGKTVVGSAATVKDWKAILDKQTDPEFAEFQRLSTKFLDAAPLAVDSKKG